MIYLYTEKSETENWILKNDLYFNLYTGNQLFTEMDKQAIYQIDKAILTKDNHIETKYGVGTIRNLSTGCKTYLNVLKNPGKTVSANECGGNVLAMLFKLDGIRLYMNCPERFEIDENIQIMFNDTDIVIGKRGYELWWTKEYERREKDDLPETQLENGHGQTGQRIGISDCGWCGGNDAHSYKDGYREGVLFLFYRDGKVLMEDRGQGFDKEAFFPNGSIEIQDKESDSYILTALFREIKEEFAGKITVKNIVDLGELKVDEISVIFYIYCITDWYGEFPEFIKEEGEPDSRLGMFSVEEAGRMVNYDSALEILKRVDNYSVSCHYDILIDENNDPVYDPEFLRKYMDKWDGREYIEKMHLDKQKSVLEIGVGTGRLATRVAPLCGEFTGIDLSPKTVERARENLEKMDNVTILRGDFLTYEFKRKFDIIYSSLTFMHIKEKQRTIQKVAELLNCKGRLLLSIDRNQSPYITYSARKVKVYPDTPKETADYIMKSGMIVLEQYDTELATVFVAGKG